MFVHELGVGAVSVDGHSQQPVHYDVRVSAKTKTTNKKICLNYIYTKYTIGASMLRSTPNSFFAPHTALKVIFLYYFFLLFPWVFFSPQLFLHLISISSIRIGTLQENGQRCLANISQHYRRRLGAVNLSKALDMNCVGSNNLKPNVLQKKKKNYTLHAGLILNK